MFVKELSHGHNTLYCILICDFIYSALPQGRSHLWLVHVILVTHWGHGIVWLTSFDIHLAHQISLVSEQTDIVLHTVSSITWVRGQIYRLCRGECKYLFALPIRAHKCYLARRQQDRLHCESLSIMGHPVEQDALNDEVNVESNHKDHNHGVGAQFVGDWHCYLKNQHRDQQPQQRIQRLHIKVKSLRILHHLIDLVQGGKEHDGRGKCEKAIGDVEYLHVSEYLASILRRDRQYDIYREIERIDGEEKTLKA